MADRANMLLKTTGGEDNVCGGTRLHSIVDGLQVRVRGQILSYKCKCVGDPKEVDWNVVVIGAQPCGEEHIRCVVLNETDDPGMLVAQYDASPAMAVVLLSNTDDGITARKRFELARCPVLLVQSSDATQLIGAMKGCEEVLGRVQIESYGGTVPGTTVREETAPVKPQERKKLGEIFKKKLFPGPPPAVDPKSQSDMGHLQLLFASEVFLPVSQDRALFAKVLHVLHCYEKSGKNCSSHAQLFKVLSKNLPSVFVKDFPYYIILAYQISRATEIYSGEEASEFIHICIEKMETEDPGKLSKTLNDIIQRGCHAVQFGHNTCTTCIFELLEKACIHLAELSLGSEQTPGSRRIYRSLVWASVALKCHTEHGLVEKWVIDLWDCRLLKMRGELVFTLEALEELREGLDWTLLLNIPSIALLSTQQMVDLVLCDGAAIRPFSHLMNYIDLMNTYMSDHLYVTGLVHLNTFLCELYKNKRQLSIEGTLTAVIQEGLAYVEKLNELLHRKRMEKVVCDHIVLKWLSLLLELVDVTQSGSEVYLGMFLSEAYSVLQTHNKHVLMEIIRITRASLPNIGEKQFLHLYKKFTFWPDELAREFLSAYKMLPAMCVSSSTWTAVFTEMIRRQSDSGRCIVFDFLKAAGNQYDEEGRSREFVCDLLDLKVPQLFVVTNDHMKGQIIDPEETISAVQSVQQKFSFFLKEYIINKALKNCLLGKMDKIMNTTFSNDDHFQQLIFSIFQKILPNAIAVEAVGESNATTLKIVVSKLAGCLAQKDPFSHQHRLCWSTVACCCLAMSALIDPHFIEWIKCYSDIVLQLGQVYYDMVQYADGVLSSCPDYRTCSDLQTYSDWVSNISQILREWYTKLHCGSFNYGELLQYQPFHSFFCEVGYKLCAEDEVIPAEELSSLKIRYEELFEQVNVHLIKYIPGNREAKHCIMPEILQEYGVRFPVELLRDLILPTEKVDSPVPTSLKGVFQPPDGVSVQAKQSLTLNALEMLVAKLNAYVRPITDHLEMLVTFHLSHNQVFKSYVLLQLEKDFCTKSQLLVNGDALWPKQSNVSCDVLGKALSSTRLLLSRIISGKSTYVETIGEGKLQFDNIEIETECQAITNYFGVHECLPEEVVDPKVFISMLELHQYACVCIPAICSLCELYKLNVCLSDPTLAQLVDISKELAPQGGKAKQLQPHEALNILRRVKELFCFMVPNVWQIGSLVSILSRNKTVHQFFCRNGFDVVHCHSLKVQLEHNVAMLDRLYAAYSVVEPFMDVKQDFKCLLTKVAGLDILSGVKKLEDVSTNLDVLSLWFSEARDDQGVPRSTEILHNSLASSIKLLSDVKSQNDELRNQNSALKEEMSNQQQKYTVHCSELQQQLKGLQEEVQSKHRMFESVQQKHKANLEWLNKMHKAELDQARNELSKQLLLQQEMIEKHTIELNEAKKVLKEELKEQSVSTTSSVCLAKRSDIKLCHDKYLGGGAWGYVVEGWFRGQRVAVKCMHNVLMNEMTLKRVQREMNTLAQVRHPNLLLFIAAVMDAQGGPMIITELLDTSLRTAYQSGLLGPGLDELIRVFIDIASALSYLHQHETPIIHRDVSSSNVLLEAMKARWKAKLSDFGSANWASQASTLGEGAIVYLAPEAFPGKRNSPQTIKIDVYSYGILMCEVALREFPSLERFDVTKEKMKADWSRLYPTVMQCVDKDPTKRPTMAQILDFLMEFSR